MEPAKVDQIQRVPEEALKVIEMGRVSEETKGLPHIVQESPGLFPGPEA
jgi:hypothetical protein